MPDVVIDNNNYIAWLYIRRGYQNILPALGPYCTCPTDACNMVLAWAIYSGIPLIAMQYNIIVQQMHTNVNDSTVKPCPEAYMDMILLKCF